MDNLFTFRAEDWLVRNITHCDNDYKFLRNRSLVIPVQFIGGINVYNLGISEFSNKECYSLDRMRLYQIQFIGTMHERFLSVYCGCAFDIYINFQTFRNGFSGFLCQYKDIIINY